MSAAAGCAGHDGSVSDDDESAPSWVREFMDALPPGPWTWEFVAPEPSELDPDPEGGGMALVASDGTWVLWADSGYGTPDVLGFGLALDPPPPAARALAMVPELLADREQLEADAVRLAFEVKRLWGLAGPDTTVSGEVAELLDRYWRGREAPPEAARDRRLGVLGELVADYEAEHGEITDDELE